MSEYLTQYSELDRPMLESAISVIETNGYWSFMYKYTPEKGKGFMWSSNVTIDNVTLDEIRDNVVKAWPGHSGASLAYTLRVIECIAKKKLAINNTPP